MTTQSSKLLNQEGTSAFDFSGNQELALDTKLPQEPQNLESVQSTPAKATANLKKVTKSKTQEPEIIFEPMSIDDLKIKVQSDLEAEVQKKSVAIMEEAEKKVRLIEDADREVLHKVDQIVGVIYETEVLHASIDEIYNVLDKLSKRARGINRKPKKRVVTPINFKSRAKK